MPETIEEKCLSKGVKLTDQRKVIAQVMSQSTDHPDVDELYNRVSKIDSKISIATVYRTVKLFEELMELNGQPKFNMTSNTSFQETLDKNDLKAMQADPKYWKEKDPAFIAKVRAGFDQLARQK